MRAQVFYRYRLDRCRVVTAVKDVDVPSTATLADLLAAGEANDGPDRNLAFEVQTDAGVWAHHDGSERPLTLPGATFLSWAELDEQDP